jgi:sialic acid synthase SpsE
VKGIHALKGSAEKRMTEAEQVSKSIGQRSAFALRDLPAGHVVTDADFRFVRPAAGIPPNDAAAVRGRRLARAVPAGHPITYVDIAP